MRSSLVSWVVLAAACSQPPTITGVDPAEGLPGTAVQVVGQRFAEGATVALVADDGARVDLPVSKRSPVVLAVTIPEGAAAGDYDLVVSDGSHEVVVDDGFTVHAPAADEPCGSLYTANTTTSLITKEVVIDRFYKDGKRETLRIDLGDIQAIEYERLALDEGRLCHVVWLRKKDGDRVRYADDAINDLKSRAYKFAQELGKPIEVTREDPAPETPAGGSDEGASAGG